MADELGEGVLGFEGGEGGARGAGVGDEEVDVADVAKDGVGDGAEVVLFGDVGAERDDAFFTLAILVGIAWLLAIIVQRSHAVVKEGLSLVVFTCGLFEPLAAPAHDVDSVSAALG